MINVLCTEKKSLYYTYKNLDCFDSERNVFSLDSRSVCIAHPPCRLFSRLRKFSTAPVEEKKIAFFCLEKIRRFGGILEHPRSSTLWHTGNFDLNGGIDTYGGFIRSVDLSWFGFPARKTTILYFVGLEPSDLPAFPLPINAIHHCIGGTSKNSNLSELPKKMRSQTPLLLIDYLIEVCRIIEEKKKTKKNLKK